MQKPIGIIIWLLLIASLGAARLNAAPCEAYFPFDGSLDDASGHGNHGLMIGAKGEPAAPQFDTGKKGQALRVTAGNAMRAFIDLHYEFCPQVTVTAWFRLASVDKSGAQYIFSTGGGSGPGVYVEGRRVHMKGTGNGIYQPNAVRSANDWWFVAAVYDHKAKEQGTYNLHWRNRVVPGIMAKHKKPPEDSFWIGTYNDRMSYTASDLYIDDLRIHPSALTPEQIRAVAAGKQLSTQTLQPTAIKPPQPLLTDTEKLITTQTRESIVAAPLPPQPQAETAASEEPALTAAEVGEGTCMVGTIRAFGGNFPPRGWAFANGDILNVQEFSALFSIVGTMYGGNGVTNFALPNIQGSQATTTGTSTLICARGIYPSRN